MNFDRRLYGGILALIGAVMFSTKAIMVKLAYQYEIDTTSLLMLRMLFSLPFFLIIATKSISNDHSQISTIKNNKIGLLTFGLLGYYIASYLDLEGLHFIDASLERVIIFIYPTLVVIISFVWLKQRVTLSQLIAIIICYLGIVVAYKGNIAVGSSDATLKGSLFVIGSALTYSIYLVGSQRMLTKMDSKIYNAIAMSIACFAIIIHNAITNGFNLFLFPYEVYMIALLIATFATVIPSFLIVEGIKILGANTSSIIGSIGPISTIILAHFILGEQINTTQWAGTLIVILGVMYILLFKNMRKEVSNT